ncbi:MAG: FHA domain-containing protein [Lentisphaerales bacterium]|nr:FHA domain-containing protein [Lentisphaerales bacterium]
MNATIYDIAKLGLNTPEFFIFNSKGTCSQEFPKDKKITIGKDASCSIQLNDQSIDDVQVIGQKFGSYMYFIESGNRNLLKYNGALCNQIIIEENERAEFKVGNSRLIYTGTKDKLKKLVLTHDIPEGSVGVRLQDKSPIFVSQGCLIMGSHRACDIQNEEWPEFAAALYFSPSGVYLERLNSSCELILAQMFIRDKIQIQKECYFTLHGKSIKLLIHGDLNEQCSIIFQNHNKVSDLCLVPLNTKEKYSIPLAANSRLTFGRSDKCDVTINSAQLSRLHAQVMCRNKFILISDNNSTNGTFINGNLTSKAKARPSDIINFGELEYLLMYDEPSTIV